MIVRLPDRVLGHDVVLHGTPAEVAAQLAAFGEAELRHAVILDLSPLCDIMLTPETPGRIAELRRLLCSQAGGGMSP